MVACGYSQIPGVDFTEHFAPVVNDVSFRIMLIAEIKWQLTSKIIDVETAFLHGNLDEEIYMNCPEGMPHELDECLLLQKTIYGLVQSARQYYKVFVQALKEIGFEGGFPDPCLWMRKSTKGIVILAIYVDDSYCCGHPEAIDEVIKLIKKKGFTVKVEDTLTDYLSCNVIFNKG